MCYKMSLTIHIYATNISQRIILTKPGLGHFNGCIPVPQHCTKMSSSTFRERVCISILYIFIVTSIQLIKVEPSHFIQSLSPTAKNIPHKYLSIPFVSLDVYQMSHDHLCFHCVFYDGLPQHSDALIWNDSCNVLLTHIPFLYGTQFFLNILKRSLHTFEQVIFPF